VRVRAQCEVDLALPPKREIVVYTPLTPLQRYYYQAILRQDPAMLPKVRPGQASRAAGKSNGAACSVLPQGFSELNVLMNLRKVRSARRRQPAFAWVVAS
jgi:SNF2 family DNA or RNA helicase